MKTKLSKLVAFLLAATVTLSFVGCSDDDKNNDSKDTSAANTSSTTKNDEKTLDSIEKVSSFNYMGIGTGKSDEEYQNSYVAKLLEEETGYKVNYNQPPSDLTDAMTAINNIFLVKEDYQAVLTSKDQFYSLMAANALYDITELVGMTKNLKDAIPDLGWDMASKNGKIYGIPTKSPKLSANTAICYRLDWLKEYNEENPNDQIPLPSEENDFTMTTSDFKKMLEYFSTKVPEGYKAMNVDTNNVYLEVILPAFGIYGEWAEVDGKVEYIINQPGFEDYVAYMQELFDEGLISYQATSGDANSVKLLQSRSIGAGKVAHWNAVTIEKSDESPTDDNIGYTKVLIPDSAKGDTSKVRMWAKESYEYFTCIPKFAEPEQAAAVIDWADKKLDPDLFRRFTIGEEGKTYELKDGKYFPILPLFDEQHGLADKYLNGTREEYGDYWLCRTRKSEAQNKLYSVIDYDIDKIAIMNPIDFMPPNDVYDQYYSGVNIDIKTILVKTLFQDASARSSLDDAIATWNNNNGSEITQAVNEWYQNWPNKDTFQYVD